VFCAGTFDDELFLFRPDTTNNPVRKQQRKKFCLVTVLLAQALTQFKISQMQAGTASLGDFGFRCLESRPFGSCDAFWRGVLTLFLHPGFLLAGAG
jgi:hypothetical protein